MALCSGLRQLRQSAFSAESKARVNSEEFKAAKALRVGCWLVSCIAALCASIPLRLAYCVLCFLCCDWHVYSRLTNQTMELHRVDQGRSNVNRSALKTTLQGAIYELKVGPPWLMICRTFSVLLVFRKISDKQNRGRAGDFGAVNSFECLFFALNTYPVLTRVDKYLLQAAASKALICQDRSKSAIIQISSKHLSGRLNQ